MVVDKKWEEDEGEAMRWECVESTKSFNVWTTFELLLETGDATFRSLLVVG